MNGVNANRYAGHCDCCKQPVAAFAGKIEKVGIGRHSKWRIWCLTCFDRSDNSGAEDRACGDRAYEESCSAACGLG